MDELVKGFERLSVQVLATADGTSASKVTKQAVQAAVAEARADATRCHQDLASRLARLESLSTAAAASGNDKDAPLDRPFSPPFGKASKAGGRSGGLRRLVECCVEELEGRLQQQCNERACKAEEAVKR
jgi:hypothetical protein